jgi:hypothetical protein
MGHDLVQVRLGQHEELTGLCSQPLGPHPNLLSGFLARDVEHAPRAGGDRGGHLQQQSGFADARIAANEDQ